MSTSALSLTRNVLLDTTPHAADARMASVRANGEECLVIMDAQRVAKVSMKRDAWKGVGLEGSEPGLLGGESFWGGFGRASRRARETRTAVVD
jgi:hypothetical protein